MAKVYADKNKISGIELNDKNTAKNIYDQYMKLFTDGAFSYIREDFDPAQNKITPRKYFSGGSAGVNPRTLKVVRSAAALTSGQRSSLNGSGSDNVVFAYELRENPSPAATAAGYVASQKVSVQAVPPLRSKPEAIGDNAMLGLKSLTKYDDPSDTIPALFKALDASSEIDQDSKDILLNLAIMHGLALGKALPTDLGSNFDMQDALAKNPAIAGTIAQYIISKLKWSMYYEDEEEKEANKALTKQLEDQANIQIKKIPSEVPRELLLGYLRLAGNIIASDLFSQGRNNQNPPVMVFEGKNFPIRTSHILNKVVFVPDFTGSFSIIIKTDEVSAGGIRVKLPGGNFDVNEVFVEDTGLAYGMGEKDIWAQIPYLGSKTINVLAQGANLDDVLIRMAEGTANTLGYNGVWPDNIGGPDMNSGGHIQPAIDRLREVYRENLKAEIRAIVEHLGSDVLKYIARSTVLKPVEERIALYDLKDPGLRSYFNTLKEIEEQTNKYFLRDDFINAMRAEILLAIKDGRMNEADGFAFDQKTEEIIDKIIGVAIGGGALEKGSLVADEGLRYVTALGNAQQLIEIIRHLVKKEKIEPGSTVSMAITGAGAVGGGMVALLTDFVNKTLKDDPVAQGVQVVVVLMSEKGTKNAAIIHKQTGFTQEDIAAVAEKIKDPNAIQ
ncbi:MAG: hypothetical protein HQL27_10175, partial [Candidatus Omnitrophica bacterium]|nr:hypothetical protein [Candidatus Omnitrophota bacterium]